MFESSVCVEVVNRWAGVTLYKEVQIIQMIEQPVKEDGKNSPVPVLISHNGHIYYFFIYRTVHLNLKRKEMFQWNITVSCGLTQVCGSVNRTEFLILVLNKNSFTNCSQVDWQIYATIYCTWSFVSFRHVFVLITLTGLTVQCMPLNAHSFILSKTLGPKILFVLFRFSLSPNVSSNFNMYFIDRDFTYYF